MGQPWSGPVKQGRLITFEGGEGAGKSTQTRRLVDWLAARGIDAVATREPGGAPGAERIRALLIEGAPDQWDARAEALLHFAARRAHLVETVWPALERGTWVVSDRFADSTMAYQGYGMGLDREMIVRLYDLTVGDFAPDLTLILDLPVAEGLARAAARGGADRYERMGSDFHERLRAGYLDIARRTPERCLVIDATGIADAVAQSVHQAVAERLVEDGRG
ncbi:MAG: dTMP kinase [Alphaproteobacteria bacterium]|nr:dTMP kinase [Alphaproteobacteria bacterium]MDP6515755.1 dTMP kinase [Alphaproteobacteria bacterium]